MTDKKIVIIGLTKETESPENPSGLEKRVAMIPQHIKLLVDSGCKVFVENGDGDGIGYSDNEYQEALMNSLIFYFFKKALEISFRN